MKNYKTAVKNASEMPNAPHYVVQVFSSISYNDGYGDRSGPSYSSATIIDQYIFTIKAEWQAYIQELYEKDRNRKDVFAFEARPAQISQKLIVDVK